MWIYIYIYTYTHKTGHNDIYSYIFIHIYIYIHAHTYINTCIHTYIHVYTWIHINTHTVHTQKKHTQKNEKEKQPFYYLLLVNVYTTLHPYLHYPENTNPAPEYVTPPLICNKTFELRCASEFLHFKRHYQSITLTFIVLYSLCESSCGSALGTDIFGCILFRHF